jgi:hypothetical protein
MEGVEDLHPLHLHVGGSGCDATVVSTVPLHGQIHRHTTGQARNKQHQQVTLTGKIPRKERKGAAVSSRQ